MVECGRWRFEVGGKSIDGWTDMDMDIDWTHWRLETGDDIDLRLLRGRRLVLKAPPQASGLFGLA